MRGTVCEGYITREQRRCGDHSIVPNMTDYNKIRHTHATHEVCVGINALLEDSTDARDVTLLRSLTQLIDLGTFSAVVTGGLGGTCA